MSYISCNKLWESEFDNIFSKKDKVQDLNFNQSKLEVHDTYKKDEKLTTNYKPSNDSDVISKAYLDEKILNINGYISYIEKEYNEIKLD